ncbi:MAG: hypothetical protein N4A31_03940 [Rickettsiales bacterium]|jgi:DnaJ-domain-containing protein 1|nr:hypothetical protein [Rickettsiales bacterium]
MKNQIHSTASRPYTGREKVSEIASLLHMAIWRLEKRKREKNLQKPLDSCSKWSVNPAPTRRFGG